VFSPEHPAAGSGLDRATLAVNRPDTPSANNGAIPAICDVVLTVGGFGNKLQGFRKPNFIVFTRKIHLSVNIKGFCTFQAAPSLSRRGRDLTRPTYFTSEVGGAAKGRRGNRQKINFFRTCVKLHKKLQEKLQKNCGHLRNRQSSSADFLMKSAENFCACIHENFWTLMDQTCLPLSVRNSQTNLHVLRVINAGK
jgi:hypothetical protein